LNNVKKGSDTMYAYCTFNMFNEYLKLYIYNCFSFFFSNRKLAKFIVVLIPLFGVLYIVFSFLYNPTLNESKDIPILYCEMFYNSFQVTPNVYTCMCTRNMYVYMKHLYMYEYTKPLHRLVYYARM
jgi:hypothetical protein